MAIDPLTYLLNSTLDNDQWDPFNETFQRTDPETRRQMLLESKYGGNLVDQQRGMAGWASDALAQRVARADALSILDQMFSHAQTGAGSATNYTTGLQKYLGSNEGIPGLPNNTISRLYHSLGDNPGTEEFDPANAGLAALLSTLQGRDAVGTYISNEAGRKLGGAAKIAAQARIADASARTANSANKFEWLKELSALEGQFGGVPVYSGNVPQTPPTTPAYPDPTPIGQTPGQYGGITVTDADFGQEKKKDASGLPHYGDH